MNQAFIVFLTNSLNIFAGKFFSSEYKQTIIHESPFCCINIQMIQTNSCFFKFKKDDRNVNNTKSVEDSSITPF